MKVDLRDRNMIVLGASADISKMQSGVNSKVTISPSGNNIPRLSIQPKFKDQLSANPSADNSKMTS